MPDSSDDAAIAIADVLLEFINALAQHAVARYGVYDDASSAKSDLFGVKLATVGKRHRADVGAYCDEIFASLRRDVARGRCASVGVVFRRANAAFDAYRFDARVDARGGETPSAARKRDARDALAATATKFVFVAGEGARKARLATAREGRVEVEIVAEATGEDAPEGWRATSTTDVDEECEVVGESAVREEIKRAVVEDTFEMVVSRVVRAE